MSTIYIVSKIGYEYNDEIYRIPKTDIGHISKPELAFSNESDAQQNCFVYNRKWLLTYNLLDYTYDTDDLIKTINKLTNKYHYQAIPNDCSDTIECFQQDNYTDDFWKLLISTINTIEQLPYVIYKVQLKNDD